MKKMVMIQISLLFLIQNIAYGQHDNLPNIIIIVADDLGYSDIGSFGAKGLTTPHLDRLADEGIRLTNFYVTSPVCSATRASLMTGCYHSRIGIHGCLLPRSHIGISKNEITIAELVKKKGYKTAIIGKWHLGDHTEALPVNHGFDYYFGLPYSNDMSPNPKNNVRRRARYHPRLPLIRNTEIIEVEPNQSQLTSRYTKEAIDFIKKCKNVPFLLYLAHTFPHVPLYVSEGFKGLTRRGIYGDVIAEIDWSLGQILLTLKKLKIDDNTLIIFMSDNGPWKEFGNHGGTCKPLRGCKSNVWEGGIRVPFIAHWSKKIPPGKISDEPAATIDILPTIAKLIGENLPENKIDGKNIWPLLSGQSNAKSPHDALFFYYGNNELQAMRSGKWKLYFPHKYNSVKQSGNNGLPGKCEMLSVGLELYDLSTDVSEAKNVAQENSDVIERMQTMADNIRDELGDSLTGKIGKSVRSAGIYNYPWYKRLYWKVRSYILRLYLKVHSYLNK